VIRPKREYRSHKPLRGGGKKEGKKETLIKFFEREQKRGELEKGEPDHSPAITDKEKKPVFVCAWKEGEGNPWGEREGKGKISLTTQEKKEKKCTGSFRAKTQGRGMFFRKKGEGRKSAFAQQREGEKKGRNLDAKTQRRKGAGRGRGGNQGFAPTTEEKKKKKLPAKRAKRIEGKKSHEKSAPYTAGENKTVGGKEGQKKEGGMIIPL